MADLVILGNGFDLSVGMKTSYKDFFSIDTPNNKQTRIITYPGTNEVRSYNYSYWDVIFREIVPLCKDKVEDWYEVEGIISQLLLLITDRNLPKHMYVDELFALARETATSEFENSALLREKLIVSKSRLEGYCLNKSAPRQLNGFLQFLFDELHLFEKEFCNYLNFIESQNDSDDAFNANTVEKIINIVKPGTSIVSFTKMEQNELDAVTILSFNFTSGLRKALNLQKQKFTNFDNWSITNIHGLARNFDVIFGIDDVQESDLFPGIYRFSKTSRILNSKQAEDFKADVIILPEEVDCIRFYGHSLNKYDYSYFQSIFDFYDLYKSKVKLKFFYSNHKTGAKDEQMNSIVRLLKRYGETLDNKDHGKNLLHKLILEKRLSLVKI